MKSRYRSRTSSSVWGNTQTQDWVTKEWLETPSYVDTYHQRMDDFVAKEVRKEGPLKGFLPPSNLDTTVVERSPMSWSMMGSVFRIQNLPIYGTYEPPIAGYSGDRASQNQHYLQQLLARTSPLRPEFSVPVFLKEFLELSQILSFTFENLTKFAGSYYLNLRFGVAPLVNDVRTLSGITASIERRIRELSSLAQVRGLKKRAYLDRVNHGSGTWRGTLSSTYGQIIQADHIWTFVERVHGTCRWVPTDQFTVPLDGLTAFNHATKLALDLDEVDVATLWQMIPFSWLIDYVYDLSSALEAYGDSVYIEPHDCCIVREYETDVQHVNPQVIFGNPSSVSFSGPGRFKTIRTVRDVVVPTTTSPVLQPLLSMSEWEALFALLASWSGNGHRRRTYAKFIRY